jgi:osmotically-inducible protein OsmY
MKAVRTSVLAVVIVALAAACGTAGKRTGEVVDDATITAAVKTKLVADRTSNLTRVDVDTTNATVYLKGTVDTPEQRARAEQLAWGAGGVRGVVNQLQVHKR